MTCKETQVIFEARQQGKKIKKEDYLAACHHALLCPFKKECSGRKVWLGNEDELSCEAVCAIFDYEMAMERGRIPLEYDGLFLLTLGHLENCPREKASQGRRKRACPAKSHPIFDQEANPPLEVGL